MFQVFGLFDKLLRVFKLGSFGTVRLLRSCVRALILSVGQILFELPCWMRNLFIELNLFVVPGRIFSSRDFV